MIVTVMLPPFQICLDEHGPVVYRYLRARVDAADADDCFQETLMAALRAYPRLGSRVNLRAWLLTIAERKAIDFYRARARRPVPQERLPETAHGGAIGDADPALWREVRALPAKQRAAILHRFVGDLRYSDIGDAIGTSEEAARQNVKAGLEKLRKVWSR